MKLENFTIKKELDEGAIIICDTNVFLRLYDYSPEYSKFALDCLESIENNMRVTYTTKIEFEKHYLKKYRGAKKRIEEINREILNLTNTYKNNAIKKLEKFDNYHFPDTEALKDNVLGSIDEIVATLEGYYNEHELLVEVNENFLETDLVEIFYKKRKNQVLQPLKLEEIYAICAEGKNRYKKSIPPGFKDKTKDGIRMYSDLILWTEIINFSKSQKVNIIFVTDDVKPDWWEQVETPQGVKSISFHESLSQEFEKETGRKITAFTSNQFFSIIALEKSITISNTTELALKLDYLNYISFVQDDIFESLEGEITFSSDEWLQDMSFGPDGRWDEFDIIDYELKSSKQSELDDDIASYLLEYTVSLSAMFLEIWGKDTDTKEFVFNPVFIGNYTAHITVLVERDLTHYSELSFQNAKIIDHLLEEVSVIFIDEDYIDEDNIEGAYTTCPTCGIGINFQNDGLNGFCSNPDCWN